jgi:hypothetical protein
LAAAALRACAADARFWFWGDQALIDVEARDSVTGRNLLGVYDRYGWHHLGPAWLVVLGLFRWLGGGSPAAVVLGSYVLEIVAVVGIVVVANRLRPGHTAWWAALVVLGYEWTFGLERLGTVWAPYAVALPAALLVLLVADVAFSSDPWVPAVAAAVCACFLCQTDVSTAVVVAALVVSVPLLRSALQVPGRFWADADRAPARSAPARAAPARSTPARSTPARSAPPRAGWHRAVGNWRRGAVAVCAVVVVIWLPPVFQQLSTRPGNFVLTYRFLSAHSADKSLGTALSAVGTLFGSFPLAIGRRFDKQDADPAWLLVRQFWARPWYLLYLAGTAGCAAVALVRRRAAAFALAAASTVGLLAVCCTTLLVYGPLYPYLVIWSGALVVPAWTAGWLALLPSVASSLSLAKRGKVPARTGPARLALPLAGAIAAVAVSVVFVVSSVPMTGMPSVLARRSWDAVAGAVMAPAVKTVYVDIGESDAMPDAAAIIDKAVRSGRRVEVNAAALYFLDPSFAHRTASQLTIVVCCGRHDRARWPSGMQMRRRVGGQYIFTSVGSSGALPETVESQRSSGVLAPARAQRS